MSMLVWNTFKNDMGGVNRTNRTWKSRNRALTHVLSSFIGTRWTQDISLVQCSAAKFKKFLEEPLHTLLTSASPFGQLIKSPGLSQATEKCKEKEQNRRCWYSVTVCGTLLPGLEIFCVFEFSSELNKVQIGRSESYAELA